MFGFEGINNVPSAYTKVYSSLAQSVEHLTVNQGVVGSSPTGGVHSEWLTYGFMWECRIRLYLRLHGQAVKTSPFHGGNTGSIPVGVIHYKYM